VIESAPCADCARRLRLILDGGEVTDDLIADMVEVLTGFVRLMSRRSAGLAASFAAHVF
jgi:predicted site-specific integrase-resolvase